MRRVIRKTARLLGKAARWVEDAMRVAQPGAEHEDVIRRENRAHDMARDPDETYYRRQYWRLMEPELSRLPAGRSARILDLGCGHGRLTLLLAEWAREGSVTGVDFLASSLETARERCRAKGLSNAEFTESEAAIFARGLPSESLDCIVCTEVLYNLPSYRETLSRLAGVLRGGGLIFASFRSQWYELQRAVRARDFDTAAFVQRERAGFCGGGAVWSCWHTPEELRELLPSCGFGRPRTFGIGVLSGLAEDPLSSLVRPSELTPSDRERLLELELALSETCAAQGRYILAIARKEK